VADVCVEIRDGGDRLSVITRNCSVATGDCSAADESDLVAHYGQTSVIE
jgi:hypothetical protein